jgi:hypothetical protein
VIPVMLAYIPGLVIGFMCSTLLLALPAARARETDWRLAESPDVARAAARALGSAGWRQGGDLAAIERALSR